MGRRGERLAARFLKKKSLRIIERNYLCPFGELDIIALDGDEVVFVEVKTRAGDEAQDLMETVGPAKWKKVEKAARHYLHYKRLADRPCRFDLITLLWPKHGKPQVEHIEDAYQPARS